MNDSSPDENGIVPWEITDVVIDTPGGKETVRGAVHPLVPGLAVTSRNFGQFDVTHIRSGRLVARGYARMDNASLTAAEYALCADFTQDADGIAAELGRTKDEPCGNPKVTSTGKDGRRQMTKGELVQILKTSIPRLDEFPWEGGDSPAHNCYDVLVLLRARAGTPASA